jgi:hypothetical protein
LSLSYTQEIQSQNCCTSNVHGPFDIDVDVKGLI